MEKHLVEKFEISPETVVAMTQAMEAMAKTFEEATSRLKEFVKLWSEAVRKNLPEEGTLWKNHSEK